MIPNLGFYRILKTGFVCPFLYCHGCPFSIFGCPIGLIQNFIVRGQVSLFTIGSLGIYGVIFGRMFCGWACPFGTLHDILAKLGGKRTLKKTRFWYTKYIILFLTIILTWLFLDTVFCKFCPSGSLFAAIPYRIIRPNFDYGLFFNVHIVTLIITVVLALLISRFWCRYLCPLGAIAGAFNKVSLVSISLDESKCVMCKACLKNCPMGINSLKEIGKSTDCILCGECIENCQEKALKFIIAK